MKVAIIGAGISGLALGESLQKKTSVDVRLFEKSKGVGGRLATRRFEHGAFDHGAQFYSLSPATESRHRQWITDGSVEYWFEDKGRPKFRGRHGMTSIAKSMSGSLKIAFECKLTKIFNQNQHWHLEFDNHTPESADHVVLTAPLPQALELLTASQISFPDPLKQIQYAKALVGLFEGSSKEILKTSPWGYVEQPAGSAIFSLTDLQKKGLSHKPAFTVTMAPEFSEKFFSESDSVISQAIFEAVLKVHPQFTWSNFQLKKWRYSHPLTTLPSLFSEIAPGLSLVGDAFGGPSVSGALRSAQAWLDQHSFQ